MRAFVLGVLAAVIIAVGAHFALGSLDWSSKQLYSDPASVRLSGPV